MDAPPLHERTFSRTLPHKRGRCRAAIGMGLAHHCLKLTFNVASFLKFVKSQKVAVLRQSEAAETTFQLSSRLHFMRARKWDGTRGQNSLVVPNIFLRKHATAR
jgi:hypothetical protein